MTAIAGIDPRIQARRTAVRRGEGQRRLRRLQAVAAVLGAFGIAFVLTRSPVMDVDHVQVEADGVDVASIRDALGVGPRRPMTEVDTQAAADAVALLPGVESVEVRRAWPNAVTVTVTARRPEVVLAAADGRWLVADGAGAIIAVTATPPEDLVPVGPIELSGAPGDVVPDRVLPATSVGAALPAALRARAERVVMGEDGAIDVVLVDGGTVTFSAESDHQAAAAAAAAVAASVAPGCLDVLDVTSPSAPALRRTDAC
jgi:cell division protein FtsQ